MGATNFATAIDAYDANEAFRTLVGDAESEHGWDPYNGTISTTSFNGRANRVADLYQTADQRDKANAKARDIIEKDDWGKKWESRCLDLGVVEWHVISWKKMPRKQGTKAPKYVTKYSIKCDGRPIERNVMYDTLADAKKALNMLMRAGELPDQGFYLTIDKVSVLDRNGGLPQMTAYERVTKTYKSKPKSLPKGAVAKAVHHYVFYGWASC